MSRFLAAACQDCGVLAALHALNQSIGWGHCSGQQLLVLERLLRSKPEGSVWVQPGYHGHPLRRALSMLLDMLCLQILGPHLEARKPGP